jgi:phospholipid transport system substrate-binding protein
MPRIFAIASRRLAAATVIFALAIGAAQAAAKSPAKAAPASPQAVVEVYYGKLVEVLRNAKALGFKGRYDKLYPAIGAAFDLPTVTRIAVGPFWGKFSSEQRKTAIAGMHKLSTATYAARFNSYAGEKFEVLKSTVSENGDAIVYTRIVQSDGKPVTINYLLRKTGTAWRIVDVHLKGTISELAKWRADFSSVVRRQGYDGLIAAIDKKVAALGSEK